MVGRARRVLRVDEGRRRAADPVASGAEVGQGGDVEILGEACAEECYHWWLPTLPRLRDAQRTDIHESMIDEQFELQMEREAAREELRKLRAKQSRSDMCLILKDDPVVLELGACVKVCVDDEDRLKFDPECFVGFVAWRHKTMWRYLVCTIREGRVFLVNQVIVNLSTNVITCVIM